MENHSNTHCQTDSQLQYRQVDEVLPCSYCRHKQARNALRGILSSSNNGDNILSVSDGDNSITFVNRNEVSKVYRGLAQDSQARLKDLVYSYSSYKAEPRQLGGIEAGYFSGSGGFYAYPYAYYPGGYL